MNRHISKFQRQGFLILMICSAIMLGIGIYMFVADFKKRGNHFFKSNGKIGYCVNIQNDKWNDADQIRFTLNVGIFTGAFWIECKDFKNTGIIPTFPKEYECAIRERIGDLLPVKEDKWYCIISGTDVVKLWSEIERDLAEYILPFFARYNTESDVIPNQFIYRKGGKR